MFYTLLYVIAIKIIHRILTAIHAAPTPREGTQPASPDDTALRRRTFPNLKNQSIIHRIARKRVILVDVYSGYNQRNGTERNFNANDAYFAPKYENCRKLQKLCCVLLLDMLRH